MSKPYAFISDQLVTYDWQKNISVSGTKARAKFDVVNGHTFNGFVQPGHVVIVGDDSTQMCTREEQDLMHFARSVNETLTSNSHRSNQIMIRDYDLLQSIMTYGSIGIGNSTAAWSKHLGGVEETLKDIESLHQQLKSGSLSRDQFIGQRQGLFTQLQNHLQGAGRYGTSLRNNTKIKGMLGISTKSYLHSGDIPGYANRISAISKAARTLSKGAYVGMALDLGSTALEVQEACSTGREEKCTKARYVEGGKLAVGVAFGSAGGAAGGLLGGALCLAVGIPTGGLGTVACVMAGGAILGWGGGKMGSAIGERAGINLYETFRNE
jgi:hypothetical protein